jgi:hypothetical protein
MFAIRLEAQMDWLKKGGYEGRACDIRPRVMRIEIDTWFNLRWLNAYLRKNLWWLEVKMIPNTKTLDRRDPSN